MNTLHAFAQRRALPLATSLLAAALAALLGGCSGLQAPKAWNATGTAATAVPATPAVPPPTAATVKLMTPAGEVAGQAILTAMPHGVEIAVSANGLPPGPHGFRFHSIGACTPGTDPASGKTVDFGAAGVQFTPASVGPAQASAPPDDDLPNLTADATGKATARYLDTTVTLTPGQTSVIGRALVVHSAPASRAAPATPSDAQGRLLCGLIVPAQVESVVGQLTLDLGRTMR